MVFSILNCVIPGLENGLFCIVGLYFGVILIVTGILCVKVACVENRSEDLG